MSSKLSIAVALSALLAASAAQAQAALFNVRLGPTFASRETNQAAFESKGGMSFGGGGGFKLGSGAFTFDPSVLIVGKTTKTGDASSTGENRLKLQYIEFAFLGTAIAMPSHRIRPYIEAGPVIDLETRCRVEFVVKDAGGTESKDEVGCDIDTTQTIDRHKVDLGLGVGGGLDFRLSEGRRIALEARYTHGFSNISASDDASLTLRNRALSIYAAYFFPFKPDM